jgi:aspartate aminotransferase
VRAAFAGVYSDRIASVPVSGTVSISDAVRRRRAEGEEVIDLSVGEPDAGTPEPVVAAAEKALRDGATTYGPSQGIPELRAAIADDHEQLRGETVDPSRVLVTPAKHALLTAFLVLLDPGDEVIVPTPAWVSYGPQVRLCNAEPVPVPVADDGRIDTEGVREAIGPDTQAILVNSPSNPMGTVQGETVMRELAELAADAGLALVSDEVYAKLTYEEGAFTSAAEVAPEELDLVTVDGVSKAYAMTGWRIGWLVGAEAFLEEAIKVQQHSITHPTLFAQHGAVEALAGEQGFVDRMRETFRNRRDLVLDRLDEMGAEYPHPGGAFYAFARFAGVEDGDDFAHRLLDETGVAVVPGEAFGPGGEGHVRLSYAAERSQLERALDAIGEVVG